MTHARAASRVTAAALAVPGAALALLAVYLLTLAPGVTFWDAGEFVTAAETFGIPHPPGTPLYVLVARAWRLLLAPLPAAFAVNVLSATATAVACALGGDLLARATGRPLAAAAATLVAGLMASVWASATEAEVYAVSLLLSVLMLWLGVRAGATGERRWLVALAYAAALAAPLHASALVAAPAAVVLAVRGRSRRDGVVLLLVMATAAFVATGRWSAAMIAAAAASVASFLPRAPRLMVPMLLLGVSPLIVLLLRARHDPLLNQGNPADWAGLIAVISREQYAVAPLWPRQAPLWLQLANLAEYADWQVALSLAPAAPPHPLRTSLSVLFAALGVAGYRRLRRDAPQLRAAVLVLLASASLGVVAYLNLKAGPSIGWGVLPDSAPHEARERDYFFALFFWTWGLLAGYGIVRGAQAWYARVPDAARRRASVACAGALLAVPLVLNWRAVDRSREPEGSAPSLVASALLAGSPRDAVLFVWGDNDTYPLWHAQAALGTRRDVLVVTIALVSADWYRDELRRRSAIDVGPWRGERQGVVAVAAEASRLGRPLAFASTVPAGVREAVPGAWRRCGAVWLIVPESCAVPADPALASWLREHPPSRHTDDTTVSMLAVLRCAANDTVTRWETDVADSLDSACNAR